MIIVTIPDGRRAALIHILLEAARFERVVMHGCVPAAGPLVVQISNALVFAGLRWRELLRILAALDDRELRYVLAAA